MRFVWGIIWVAIGILIMRYNFTIVQLFGKIDFAERYLSGGFGGTYTLYKIVGVGVVVLGMLYAFNAMDFLVRPLSPLFGG